MNTQNRLMLHVCCAPCTSYPHKELKEEGFAVSGYWSNPNVHGFTEYQKRLMSMGYYLSLNSDMGFVEDEYEPGKWFKEVTDYASKARCSKCYKIRLESTARVARENNIDNFTTTLLYSKYQKHDEIREIGEDIAEEYSLNFVYRDFREGWKEGIVSSKKMGLYRQQYCGCIFSEKERFNVS